MKVLLSLLSVINFFLYSCNTSNSQPSNDSLLLRENELLKRELAIKQKELDLEKRNVGNSDLIKKEVPISELYKKVKTGVFLIYAYGSDNVALGSGFFINKNGIAISNYHVFENAQKAVVVLDNREEKMITKIITSNKELDYVIFKVGFSDASFYPLNVSKHLPDVGESCFAIGNPRGLLQTLSIGNISGYRISDKQRYIQTTAEITHGSSGGPLFNKQGEVIGITTMGLNDANINFAIEINNIPYSGYSDDSISDTEMLTKVSPDEARTIIGNYYQCLYDRDYNRLSEFYAPVLERYYTEFNITSTKAVKNASEYWGKYKILQATTNINWNTFKSVSLSNGDLIVSFNMDYILMRMESNKPSRFNLDINMVLDKNIRIKSVFENIISKI